MKSPFRDRLLLLAFLVILLAFGALAARKFFLSRPPVAPPPSPVQEAPKQLRDVVLYFSASDGSRLVPEGREIECLEEIDCVRETVQALVDGPVGDLVPVIPSHAVVRDIRIAEGTATVDFSRELVADHPGGSLSELFTVYGLADTLASNFRNIRQVRILVEGEPVETLKGHVALKEPVPADFSYARPSGETPEASPEGGGEAAPENQTSPEGKVE